MPTTIDLSTLTGPDATGRRVVVLGGTGAVAEGIVRAWLDAGAEVVVPSRSEQSAARLESSFASHSGRERLHAEVGDYTSFTGAEEMATRIDGAHGPVSDVIASIGGWWQRGPLWSVSAEDWQRYFVDLTTAHVANVRAWVPRLPDSGSYHLILGGSAERPVPGASIINMEQAGLLMMQRVLAAEVGEQRRVFAEVLGPVVTRQRDWVDPDWVSQDEVGLVTVSIAVDRSQASAEIELRSKSQILEVLRTVGVVPAADQPVGQPEATGPASESD